MLFLLGATRTFAAVDYTNGPAALNLALVAKLIVGATVEIDEATGRPSIDPVTRKTIPSLYGMGAQTFDRAGKVTSKTDTYAGKMFGAKYGNAEFLADLLSAGVLGDTQTKGWGLFAVRSGDTYRVEARKPGRTNIDLSNYISVETTNVTSGYTRTRTTTYKNRLPDQTTGRGSFTDEGAVRVLFRELSDSEGPLIPEFHMDGTMVVSGSEYRWYPESPKKHPQSFIDLRGSVRFNNLVGAYLPPGWPQETADESGNPALLLTGSASLGPEKEVPRP